MSEKQTVVTVMAGNKLAIEHAIIRFRNFTGAPDAYHPDGYAYGLFAVFLDEDAAKMISELGYNVKRLKPAEDDPNDLGQAYMNVKVSKKFFPNDVHKIAGDSDLLLDAESIEGLDHSEILNADIVINPYHYNVRGNTGISAYLDSGSYFELVPSPFAAKYAR